ncbi:uncharacterized protein KD926_003174 [Aspergillus affinis]|uniref:uncharacterized protein n=1 Tax=Aspergillus affinis TaxID=1070780 RepID=UPI0022FEA4F2|nr:uncharacterized protein KD926_003174 [Aspergillus affinis]KAI9035634.1 hypothetical protein KD926_003174 [Aspergillus affinis]
MSDPKKYTVGWICALPVEFVAAQTFLDEEHGQPEFVHPHDANGYKLGKIGPHNVVIATLPDGEYGTACAARVAANMLSSFPNIRIGLMVGIGGGAPSRTNDIRLGDVVVSAPRDGERGVFEYDFGRTVQGKKFQVTRLLDQPPTILRSVVTVIQTDHRRKGHRIQEAVDAVLADNPRLKAKFQRPHPKTDRLFKSEIIYDPERQFNETSLVKRREREPHEDNPAIHYGTIASANQLMKDATIRDKLVEEKNVLCFEMEAAGLMNHFPCLVIRGICDYSDTHKNDAWQGYAAMVAAGFAKELLMEIAPNRVEVQRRIQELWRDITDLKATADKNHTEAILNWLASNDHNIQHCRFSEMRHKNTGLSFLRSTEFLQWSNGRGQILFCPGPPGVGKTIMTSTVANHLLSRRSHANIGVAFLYLDYAAQQEQSLRCLMAALLRQLAYSGNGVHDSVQMMFNDRHNIPNPTPEYLIAALHSVIGAFDAIFLLVDALDECQSPKCRKDLLMELIRLQSHLNVNIFLTSRPDHRILELFSPTALIIKELLGSPDDLDAYLSDELLRVYTGVKAYPGVLYQAKRDILQAAGGVFLIVRLYLNLLYDRDISSLDEFKAALVEINAGLSTSSHQRSKLLEDTYTKTIKRLQLRSDTLAMRAIMWIACSKRPMTFPLLQQALGVQVSEGTTNSTSGTPNIASMEKIFSACLGLLTMNPTTLQIVFAHNTAHEYFVSSQREHFPHADAEMTQTCVSMLLHFTPPVTLAWPLQVLPFEQLSNLRDSCQFYFYAASEWGHYARNTSAHRDLILKFLKQEDKVNATEYGLSISLGHIRLIKFSLDSTPWTMAPPVRPIHLVAYFGLEDVFRHLTEMSPSRNALFSSRALAKELNHEATALHMTPLHYAILGGHKGMVQLLLDHGADINKADLQGQTPCALADKCRNWDIHKLLVEHGGKTMAETAKEQVWKWSTEFIKFVRMSL